MQFGVPAIDARVIPMHPGDMTVFCARPGHGKSSMLAYLARAEGKRIQERGTADTECVVYITWEQVTEEIDSVLQGTREYSISDGVWGRADMDAVKRNAGVARHRSRPGIDTTTAKPASSSGAFR